MPEALFSPWFITSAECTPLAQLKPDRYFRLHDRTIPNVSLFSRFYLYQVMGVRDRPLLYHSVGYPSVRSVVVPAALGEIMLHSHGDLSILNASQNPRYYGDGRSFICLRNAMGDDRLSTCASQSLGVGASLTLVSDSSQNNELSPLFVSQISWRVCVCQAPPRQSGSDDPHRGGALSSARAAPQPAPANMTSLAACVDCPLPTDCLSV
jgi:hypothetical protein